MIPDVTPNGVFYLPPTGWLTSFYNPPKILNKVKLKLISKFLLEKYGWRFDDAKLNQDLLLQYELLNDEQISLFTEDLKKANERIEELNTDYYFKKIE